MYNHWDGLQDGLVGFVVSHAVLATFFSSEIVSEEIYYKIWFGLILLGSLYLISRLIQNKLQGNDSEQGQVDESTVRLLDECNENDEVSNAVESQSQKGGSHRFGTKSPFWFTRVWPGFEEEAEQESKAESDAKQSPSSQDLKSSSIFPNGQTSIIKKQTMKTMLIRFLVITLSAATPYYLAFLSSWMFNAFGITGLLFSVAEAIATIARCIYWLQLWVGQHRRVCPMWKLTPRFPDSEWPLCEVVIAHYQEPTDEIAGTLRAALDMDYPHDKFIVSILDDGYFTMGPDEDYVVTAGGRDLEAMVIAMYERLGDPSCMATSQWTEVPESCGVPGCSDRGSRVLVISKPFLPRVRIVCRRKAADSYFKGGNLNNFIYNIASPYSSFLSILDADMVPSEDFLQLSLPLYFSYVPNRDKESGGKWRCNWEVAMTASPQHYRNLETNGTDDDPLNQKNESYTRRLQQRMDACGLVHFCGTNTTFFIPAVRDAMGFVTGLLSEDTPTGLVLSQLGWDSYFIDTALAVGTVKESASDTMMQRFRWMAGNGLLFLFGRNFGSQGFLQHGPARARALRIANMKDTSNKETFKNLSDTKEVLTHCPSRFGDMQYCNFELSMPANPSSSSTDSSVSDVYKFLKAVGSIDVGYSIRKEKANCWKRKICLWSIYDIGMGYMFVSTFWHLCYHALLFDSLIFSDGERPVTMQPLFGVLYSVGSFAIILVLGPANGVLRVVNEWFAWSWLKVIAAAHVLSISRSVPLDDYDEEVDVDSEIEVDNEIDNEESRLLRNRKKDNVGSLEKHVKSSGKNKDKDDVKRKSVKKPSGGGWNAASNLRIWLLIPPMIYYLFVAALLVKTILFGANGQSILTDTLMRGSDDSDWLMPSVTLPQHMLGIFLGVLFLIHSWPTFKVSALEVVGLKMFQGECQGGAVFAAFLLIAPLLLILFANPDVKIIGRIETKQFGSDALSQSNAGLLYDWPIGAYDYNHLHPQPLPKWSLPLLASHGNRPPSSSVHNLTSPPLMLKHNQRIYPKVNAHILRMIRQKKDNKNVEESVVPTTVDDRVGEKLIKRGEPAMVYGDAGTMLGFNIDVSQVGCGCTAALYMVAMPSDEHAKPGTCPERDGYCDANKVCGLGCFEVDLFEGSLYDMQVAIHACRNHHKKQPKQNLRKLLEGNEVEEGDEFSSNYYASCDGEGCFSKMSTHAPRDSYGPGDQYTIDTTKPFHVSIYFRGYHQTKDSKEGVVDEHVENENIQHLNVLVSVEVEVKQGVDRTVLLTIDDSECLRSFAAKHSMMKSQGLPSIGHHISSGGWTRPQMMMNTLSNGQRLVSSLWGGGGSDFKHIETNGEEDSDAAFGCDHEVCARRLSLKKAIQGRDKKVIEIESLITEAEENSEQADITSPPVADTIQTPPVPVQTPPVIVQSPPVPVQTPPVADTVQTPPVIVQSPPVADTVQTPPVTVQTPPVIVQSPPVPVQTPPVTDTVQTPPVIVQSPPAVTQPDMLSSENGVHLETHVTSDNSKSHEVHEKHKHRGCFWNEQQKKMICPHDTDNSVKEEHGIVTKEEHMDHEKPVQNEKPLEHEKPIQHEKPKHHGCFWSVQQKKTICPHDTEYTRRTLLSDTFINSSSIKQEDTLSLIEGSKEWLLSKTEKGGIEDDILRRRLGCHYVAWKKQNVCDGPATKPHSNPTHQNTQNTQNSQEENPTDKDEDVIGHRDQDNIEAAKQAMAAQVAAEALKNLPPPEPGHCCFSGNCNGCDSVAARHNFCSGSQNACEQDCEFVWCKGIEPPPPSSLSGDGKGGDDSLQLEPGRCCFFGDGCGDECGSFADDGNFCAISSDTCERQCGKHSKEFKWCPLEKQEEQDVIDTQICDPDHAFASFSNLTISSYL